MLSVCIIAKNEEGMLEDCLRSVITVADEIILLDTGSTDKTLAIAAKYDCKIYHYIWDGNFTRARNTACAYARHEWILCIDCDERLQSADTVLKAMACAPPNTGCIITERHNHAVSKGGERSNEMRGNARLFKNRPEIYWSFEVHEEAWSSCVKSGLGLYHSNIVLDHEVGRHGFERYVEKQRFYETLIDRCIQKENAQHYLFHSAKTKMLFEEYNKALAIFDLAEKAAGYQVHNDAFIKCYKGYSAFMKNDLKTAEENLLQALELIPGLSAANFYLVSLYLRQNKFKEAMDCTNGLVLTCSAGKPVTVADMYFKEAQVNYWKAFITMQTGELEAAEKLLIHEKPDRDSARSLALLSRIEFIKGNKEKSRQWLEEALVHNPDWNYLKQLKM